MNLVEKKYLLGKEDYSYKQFIFGYFSELFEANFCHIFRNIWQFINRYLSSNSIEETN